MGRKRGGKNADTELKTAEVLEKRIIEDKTHEQIAEELGVAQTTVSRRLHKAIGSQLAQEMIETSRSRLLQMLSRCDDAYHRVLTWNAPENFGNQVRVATAIYKTFGLIKEEPDQTLNVIVPIKVKIQDPQGERTYEVSAADGSRRSHPALETGSGVRESE